MRRPRSGSVRNGLLKGKLVPFFALCAGLGIATCAPGQVGTARIITTIAGRDFTFPEKPVPAVAAPIGPISGITRDGHGNLFISDTGNHLVFKIDTKGILSIVAGNGIGGSSGDGGAATSASLSAPNGVAVDGNGNLFIADAGSVRVVDPSGIINTIPGLALNAALAVDQAGNLYTDTADSTGVQMRTPSGVATFVAGGCGVSCIGGTKARDTFLEVVGIAVDNTGNLFITDYSGTLYRVPPDGTIHTVATALRSPRGLCIDTAGNVFVSEFNQKDRNSNRVLKITPQGSITTIAGNGDPAFAGDNGPGASASLGPVGVSVDDLDTLFIADNYNNRVRRLLANGSISTVAGNGGFQFGGDFGPASSASLRTPSGIALDTFGNLLIADQSNNRIRKIAPDRTITTIAGNGVPAFRGDGGPATAASLAAPTGVAVDTAGNIFVVDAGNNRVRKITPEGIISTFAGNGDSLFAFGFPAFDLSPGYTDPFYSGDGNPAIDVPLSFPSGIAVNAAGELLVSELFRIRKVTTDGKISTVAGKGPGVCPPTPFGGFCGSYGGDDGPAVDATLNGPAAVAVDSQGDIIIADTGNGRVRRVTPDGQITSIVQTDSVVFDPHTPPIMRDQPTGVTVDPMGVPYYSDVFFQDQNLFSIKLPQAAKVAIVSSSGALTTVAGGSSQGFSGDGGSAASAALNFPSGLAIDAAGNLFIADAGNNRIREVLANPPAVSLAPQTLSFAAGSQEAPTLPQNLSLTSAVEGLTYTASVPDSVNWLRVSPSTGASPRLIQIIADPTTLSPATYRTKITIAVPNANPSSFSVPVTFTVNTGKPPTLSVDKTNLSFPFPRHGSFRAQTLTVSNSGGGTLRFRAAATTSPGFHWLTLSPSSGQAMPATPVPLTVKADPAGLSPGTYTGQVTVAAGSESRRVPVILIISAQDQAILLSQTGLSFVGVSQGGVLPSQSFSVLNIGSGAMRWKVSTSPPGATWLHVTPASGDTDAAGIVPTVQVTADASSLPKGTYYALIRVDAPGAANTPQVLTVVAKVQAPGSDPGAVVRPAELLFTAGAGESPSSQNLFVYNVAAAPKTLHASPDKLLNVAVLPTDVTLDPNQPAQVVVQPFTKGLAAGVYNSVITLQFSDGRVLSANARVIVSAGANSGSGTLEQGHIADRSDVGAPCTPSKLVLASNTLAESLAVPAGYPVGLEVNVKDDCGTALSSGSVTATFSNSDPELQLQSLKNGLWNATWQTNSAGEGAVTITLRATDPQGKLQGSSVVNTALAATTEQPVFALQGIVSAAGGQPFIPVAPGSLISIHGKNLAGAATLPTSKPLPIQLGDSLVTMAGLALPLYSTSDGQINAQVPFEVEANTVSYLVVSHSNALSLPVGVNIAAAQPAVFTDTKVAPNQGVIIVLRGRQQFEARPETPASAGDLIVVYCDGLGAVRPAIASGTLGNGEPTANTPAVTIGGVPAAVKFSGLAPGFVGLYQINTVVPAGAPKGKAVPLTITIAGQTSPTVVMAIR